VQTVRLAPPSIPFGYGDAGHVVKVKTSSRTWVMKSRPQTRASGSGLQAQTPSLLRLECLFDNQPGENGV
jgi:hypothetical protein